MSKTFCIITVDEVTSLPVDFSQVMETSASTLRHSVDGTKTFVKYLGTQPSFLNGKTEYTYESFLTVLQGAEWTFQLGTLDLSGVSTTATLNGTNSNQTASLSGGSSTVSAQYAWTALDSEGNSSSDVVFSAANAATTNITYNASGDFTVKMSVTDANQIDITTENIVTVTVS